MNRFKYILLLLLCILYAHGAAQTARMLPNVTPAGKGKVNTRVDNIGYWMKMVRLGYVLPSPASQVPSPAYTGTKIREYLPGLPPMGASPFFRMPLSPVNSPDIPVTGETDVTQSENSVFIDPEDENSVLNSNNSSSWIQGYALNPYGADALYSYDTALTWAGSTEGVNGNNAGDPATAIGRNGWWYTGRISADYGQSVSYSKDRAKTWKRVRVGNGPGAGIGLLDKNHLCIDNALSSPFQGNLYAAWTNFIPGDPDTNQVEIVRSTNQGLTWSAPYNISYGASALKLNHGVNLQTGPNGELYAAWSIYDTWPSDETAIGFTRSVDGGGIFAPATRILSNIKGIRASMTRKNMRVSSFPAMAVDNSTGPHRGTIYLVWANRGVPGINTGNDIDIWMLRSANGGNAWDAPIRVNQDPPGQGKEHFLPWITCDPVTGGLCVIYYDDRDAADTSQVSTYVSVSYDGGNSWSDMQVSDHIFSPEPIPGLAFTYFGDYIGIQSLNMRVYPLWTDNHDGRAMTYVSPFDLGPNPNQPWVVYHSDSLATVSGSGGATLNYGDSLYLSLRLKNAGDQPATAVSAVVTSPSPYILITDSTADYGLIGLGQTGFAPNGYTLRVSDTIPDNQMVRFNVRASNSDSTWYSHFSIEAHAPALKINDLSVVDTLVGNHNGRPDPGETVELVVPVANTGDFPCSNTYIKLATTSPWLSVLSDSIFLSTIPARGAKSAVFTILVSPQTPIGNGSDLVFTAQSGLYDTRRTFRLMTGQVIEDWESQGFTNMPWQWLGSKPWVISATSPWEGSFCSASGAITDYQNSQMILEYESAVDDSISFYFRTSSEQDYDFLMFTVDGVLKDQWSGETPWTRAAFRVPPGQHTFKWIYLKDLAIAGGFDRAWVDFISLPPPVLPAVDPGAGVTVCAGMDVALHGVSDHCDSTRWTTSGDGIFQDDTALVTSYTPGSLDIASGNTVLTLTGYGPYGNSSADKPVGIHPRPPADISVFPQDSVCAGQVVLLASDTAGVSAFQWTPGNFTGHEAAYDTAVTGGPGHFLVRLVTKNKFQCQNTDSVYLTFKNCTGTGEKETLTTALFPNPTNGFVTLETRTPEPGPIVITLTNEPGMVVFSYKDPEHLTYRLKTFNWTYLPDGLYLLSLTTTRVTTVYKLIISR